MDFDEFKLRMQAAFEAYNINEKQANTLLEKRANPAAAVAGIASFFPNMLNSVSTAGSNIMSGVGNTLNAAKEIGMHGLLIPPIAGAGVGAVGGLISGTAAGKVNEALGWPEKNTEEKRIMDEIQTREMIKQIEKHRERIDQMNNMYSRSA